MKRWTFVVLAAVLLLAVVAPVGAVRPGEVRALFEADIVGLPGVEDPTKGEVYVREDGSGKVEIEVTDAPEGTEYLVYVGQASPGNPWTIPSPWTHLGPMDKIGDGEYKLDFQLDPGYGVVFAINSLSVDDVLTNQFVSGFVVP